MCFSLLLLWNLELKNATNFALFTNMDALWSTPQLPTENHNPRPLYPTLAPVNWMLFLFIFGVIYTQFPLCKWTGNRCGDLFISEIPQREIQVNTDVWGWLCTRMQKGSRQWLNWLPGFPAPNLHFLTVSTCVCPSAQSQVMAGVQAGFPNGVTEPSACLPRTRSAFTAEAQWTLKVRGLRGHSVHDSISNGKTK